MEKHRPLIRPGLSVDIVSRSGHIKSSLYEVITRRIIIARTSSPPMTEEDLNREVFFTFLMIRTQRHHKSMDFPVQVVAAMALWRRYLREDLPRIEKNRSNSGPLVWPVIAARRGMKSFLPRRPVFSLRSGISVP